MNNATTHARQLIQAIDAIAATNEELANLASHQRSAIAAMRHEDIHAIVQKQKLVGHTLADAEDKRRQAARDLTQSLGLHASTDIQDLARALGTIEPTLGQALLDAATRARHAIIDCQRQQGVVHAAATSIVAHLDGLARQVLAHLNKAGVYAATGAIAPARIPRGVDIVS